MKKNKVLIYDGGLVDYEPLDAPLIIDLDGISLNCPVQVTILGGYPVGNACVWRDEDEYWRVSLCADIEITKLDDFDQNMVANLKFACDIVVQCDRYVPKNTSFDVNGGTFMAGEKGAWLITKAKLKAVTATPNDKPDWKIDHDKGENIMDENQETLEAHFTNDELKNFAEGKINLTIPLVYEDEDKIQHNSGEVTLTHVKYGETNNEGIIAETFCWPYQLNDVGTHEVVFALQVYTQDFELLSFEFACDSSPSRHVGFLPFGLDCIVPVNVKISRKTNRATHNDTSNEPLNASQKKIAEKCDAIKDMLLEKNRKYGNSALNPVRVFSKADTVEQIKVRMDDKLSRIRNEQGDEDEDVYMDLAGYLVLMLIAKEEQKKTKGETDK